MADTLRGDIWMGDLSPTRGREQSGRRPLLIVSDDLFNRGAADLVIVVPLTTRDKGIVSHVEIRPPEGGVSQISYIKCQDIRSIAKERMHTYIGSVSETTMQEVELKLKLLLQLG